MTERILSETVTEYPRLKMRETEIVRIAGQRAHSVGTVISVVFCGIFLMWAAVAAVYDIRRFGSVDGFFFVFWITVTAVVTMASYKVAFHWSRVAEIDRQTEWLNAPVKEITKEYIDQQTAVLDYATGTNADDVMLVNQREVMDKHEEPSTVDGMEFTSDQMAFLRRLAIRDNYINRDDVWRAMNEAGLIEGSYTAHFRLARKIFIRREWVADNRWTPKAYTEFLKVKPPYSAEENQNSVGFSRDDDDDDE